MIWYNQRMLVYPSGFEAYPRSMLPTNAQALLTKI